VRKMTDLFRRLSNSIKKKTVRTSESSDQDDAEDRKNTDLFRRIAHNRRKSQIGENSSSDFDKHFGIVGLIYSGKSDFIDAIRGIYNGEPGCTDKLNVSTPLTYEFTDTDHKGIILHEIPHPPPVSDSFTITPEREEKVIDYFRKHKFHKLRAIMVLIPGKLREEEMLMASIAHYNKCDLTFILTKSEKNLRDECALNAKPTPEDVRNYIEKTHKYIEESIIRYYAEMRDVPKFCICIDTLRQLVFQKQPEIEFEERKLLVHLKERGLDLLLSCEGEK